VVTAILDEIPEEFTLWDCVSPDGEGSTRSSPGR
jgi:hypothetical protein